MSKRRTQPSHVALVLDNRGRLTTRRVVTQFPAGGEILTAPVWAGICGTDLQIMRGVRPDSATILGHEGVARIIRTGAGVEGVEVEQMMVFNPVDATDQNNILGHSTEGIFQRRFLVSRAAAERGQLVPFDARLPPSCGPLVEPLATVIYGHELVERAAQPKSIAVIGAGPIGLLHVLYAKTRSYRNVFLVHNSKERLEWAVGRGIVKAEETLLDSPELEDSLLERSGGRGIEAIFLCTTRPPACALLSRALRFLRDAGCIDLVVGFPDGATIAELPRVELNSIRRANHCGIPEAGVISRCRTIAGKELYLTGHRGTAARHLQAAMALLRERQQLFAPIITHIISLEAAPLILEHMRLSGNRRFEGREVVKMLINFALKGCRIETPEGWPA